MICGPQDAFSVVRLSPEDDVDRVAKRLDRALTRLGVADDDEALIFADLFGAAPANAAAMLLRTRPNLEIVAGMNLPMVLDTLLAREGVSARDLSRQAIEAGRESVSRRGGRHSIGARTRRRPFEGGIVSVRHVRIDNRLVHGQVVVTWLQAERADTILVANDGIAGDEFQKTMLLAVKPPSVNEMILSVDDALAYLKDPAHADKQIFLLVKDPADALRLHRGGLGVKTMNVGNMAFAAGSARDADDLRHRSRRGGVQGARGRGSRAHRADDADRGAATTS